MSEVILRLLALIGAMAVVGVVLCLVVMLLGWIGEVIGNKRYSYKVAHRFDKPPTAECYCKDCSDWSEEKERCKRFDYPAPDCGFCWRADLMTREESERREELKEQWRGGDNRKDDR